MNELSPRERVRITLSHQEPDKPTPQLLSSGAWLTLSLTPEPGQNLDLFIAAGTAYVDVSGWPDFAECEGYGCVPARTNFESGGAFSLALGSGITYQLRGPLSVRFHVRLLSESSVLRERIVQFGGGVGLRVQ